MAVKGVGIDIHSPRIDGNLEVLERDLAYYAGCGFDYAEIPVHGVDAIFAGELLDRRVQQVKEVLARFALGYTVHAPDSVNLFDVERLSMHKAALVATLAFAREIGAEVVVYHAGAINALNEGLSLNQEQLKEIERQALTEIADMTADWSVPIAVENVGLNSYSAFLPALVEQVKAIDRANVGITLDIGHAYLTAGALGYDLPESVRLTAGEVIHFHIHDDFGLLADPHFDASYILRAPLGLGDLHMPPGWGTIPFRDLLAGIKSPPAVFLLELHPRWMDVAAEARATARELAALIG